MNLQNLKLKASTLCAGGTLLVFGGFLTVNLAGCGGGGGGGLITTPTPIPVGATFRLVQQDSTPSRGGSLTLTGNGKTFQGNADNNGVVVLSGVTPGTYTATFTANGNGGALPATTRQITVTRDVVQNFILVQGDTGNGAFTLSGTVFSNNNAEFSNCTASSTPITAAVLISVRDLNDTTGQPIIAQIVRPAQDVNVPAALRGRYTISIPTMPRSFRVEVAPADNNGVIFAGFSATTTFTSGVNTINNVNICANTNGQAPSPFNPTPTPTVTPTGGGVIPGATATTIPTLAPNPTATIDPNPTATMQPNPTSTSPIPSFTPIQPVAPGGTTGGTTIQPVAPGGTTGVGTNSGTTGGLVTSGGVTNSGTTGGLITAGGGTATGNTNVVVPFARSNR